MTDESLSRREMLEVTAASLAAPLLRAGLAAVEALSKELNGQAFLQGSAEQRVAVLTRMAAGEHDPKTPADHFFQTLKHWTARAYYTSKVGIHADQQYKGNVYQRGEYAGFDAK